MTNKEGMEFSTRKPAPKAKLKSTKSVPAVPLGSMSRFSLRSSSGKKKERSASSGGSSSSVQRPLCTLSVRNQSCAMNTATTPSLKPTPYLEPINTRTTGKQVGGTRAPLIPPPKIVADRKARSDETNSKVVARTQSERTSTVLSKQRTRRRELAYLIVDLRTGRPTYSTKSVDDFQKLRQPTPESDLEQSQSPFPPRSNTMSVPGEQKPAPAPRPRVRKANSFTKGPATEPKVVTNGVKRENSTSPVPTALTPSPNTRPVPAPRLSSYRAITLLEGPVAESRDVTNSVKSENSTSPIPTALTPSPNTRPVPAPRLSSYRAITLLEGPVAESRDVTSGVKSDHSTSPISTTLTPLPNTQPVPTPRHRTTICKTTSLPPSSQLRDRERAGDSPTCNQEASRENSLPKQVPIKTRPLRPPPPNPKALQRIKTKSLTRFPGNDNDPKLASGINTSVTHSKSLETVAEVNFEGSVEAINATKPLTEMVPPPSRPPPRASKSLAQSPLSSHSKSVSVFEQKTQDDSYTEDIYEEIDISIPIPPPRTKNKERGRSKTSIFHSRKPPCKKALGSATPPKSDPVARKRRPPPPPPPPISILPSLPFDEPTLVDGPGHDYTEISPTESSEVGGIFQYEYVASEVGDVTEDEPDVGGVEEYVEMQPLPAWDDSGEVVIQGSPPVIEEEAEQDRDSYVEMDPTGVAEEEPNYVEMDPHSYIPPPPLYYASKDLLAQRPDLQVDHKKKTKKFTRK